MALSLPISGSLENSCGSIIREDVFLSEHGPFPAYLRKFYLSDCDRFSCAGTVTELHYAKECDLTFSWLMMKPAPNFEQEWLKRGANNLVSRQQKNDGRLSFSNK
ncbi:hypothetical protein AVEN_44665-1 [Araneus ventricosus]|uniref:Uncharacterized protein n=1 Tax=Araneus ventricosus TaxID=182803 RepID=A0A4Y2R562_ARAVE|nr:hypothetical protein AVEN_44665-1 [Araneus ventricosus]